MSNSSMEPNDQEALCISDLYRKKLGQAANFRRLAIEECTETIRCHFQDRAFNLESQATELAHCLALFGDSPIASMDIEKHLVAVEQMTCEESNPWARGLATIGKQLDGGSQTKP